MLEKVISGGQTGADQAGWRAARFCGLATGGWMPLGFLTEAGPRPEFAQLYGAIETRTDDYTERTRANVRDSDGTIWFGATDSPGGRCTLEACRQNGKPFVVIADTGTSDPPRSVADWIRTSRINTLNVAGNRESTEVGIGERVERNLVRLFASLRVTH
jgi:hypothetical protein